MAQHAKVSKVDERGCEKVVKIRGSGYGLARKSKQSRQEGLQESQVQVMDRHAKVSKVDER